MLKWLHMDPNQQPQPTPPQSSDPQPAQSQSAQPVQPYMPQTPTSYSSQPTNYDPHYLDSIAPPPPRASFFSGSFGKIFFIMLGVFVFAVSLIIAFSGGDNTADLQQVVVRLTNMEQTLKKVQPNLKSNNLSQTNSTYKLWVTDNQTKGEKLLNQAGVKKTQYSKKMVASEKKAADDLDSKFEDARLNAVLDRVYAHTMTAETDKLITLLNAMSRNSKAKAIRDYAKAASNNLKNIQKSFDSYVDNGN